MRTHCLCALWLLACALPFCCSGQDSLSPQEIRTRKKILSASSAVITVGSLAVLHQAWYKEYNTGKFHFFDDHAEWLQMDKVGHVYSNYHISDKMMSAYEWAGFSKSKVLLYGGGIGFAYMTCVEMLDGYSRGWGFSIADELSNLLGASIAVSQKALWQQQHFRLKFSYAESGLAQYRPGTLGNSWSTQLLKDYNAQTYWLSFNPFCFSKGKVFGIPDWLSLSLGYSAYGMLGGHYNPVLPVDKNGNVIALERERRFYLSLDVDFEKIKTRKRWLKTAFKALNLLKFPAPALQLAGGKLKWYALYY